LAKLSRCTARVGQSRIYRYTVYDRIVGDFPANKLYIHRIFAEDIIWAKAKTCCFLHERWNYSHVTSTWINMDPTFKLMLSL
jgi:hypothetical protein